MSFIVIQSAVYRILPRTLLPVALALAGCAAPSHKSVVPPTPEPRVISTRTGVASWYGGRWIGRKTASGERYRKNDFTAAHRKLPFGTRARVTNLRNGKSVTVCINNRGPYIRGRIIDLSAAAAKDIGLDRCGLAKVKLEVLEFPNR